MSIAEHALAAAARGWHIHPLREGDKRPVRGQRGQHDATADPEVIHRWWTEWPKSNYGVNCERSGLCAIDIDVHRGAVGDRTWAALEAENGATPTYSVRTPSGGLHLYYRTDNTALTNTAGKLGPGIDSRSNGYVVGAGSLIGGGEYVVESDIEPAPLPLWIEKALLAPKATKRPAPPVSTPAPVEAVRDRLRGLAAELGLAPDGAGNNAAASIAFMAGQYVGAGQVAAHEAEEILMQGVSGWSWASPEDEATMRGTIRAQISAGSAQPRAWVAPSAPTAPSGDDGESRSMTSWGTDAGLARVVAEVLGGDWIYVVGSGWLRWTGKYWKEVAEAYAEREVRQVFMGLFEEAAARWGRTGVEKHEKQAKALKACLSNGRLASTLKELRLIVLHDVDELNQHPSLLNTPGGVVDLVTGEVRPHDKDLMMTQITTGSYRPGFTHPDWEASLVALPEETRAYLQLRMGQAAHGEQPESDDMMIFTGGGANGKSSVLTDGLMPALGGYALLADPQLILPTRDGGASPERAALMGVRLAVFEELPEGRSLNVTKVKQLVGTSVVTARKLYQEGVTFRASHTLVATTNYLPVVSETDDGTWRRLCRIHFPYRFRSVPVDPDDRQGDPGLKGRMRSGRGGRADAVVTWVVEGAIAYNRDRDATSYERRPPEVERVCMAWRAEADRIMAFFSDRLVPDPSRCVAKADVFASFCDFMAASGHSKWSMETFMQRLTGHQLWRKHGLSEAQPRSVGAELSRPTGFGDGESHFVFNAPKIPARPRVVRGVRFVAPGD